MFVYIVISYNFRIILIAWYSYTLKLSEIYFVSEYEHEKYFNNKKCKSVKIIF